MTCVSNHAILVMDLLILFFTDNVISLLSNVERLMRDIQCSTSHVASQVSDQMPIVTLH